MSTTNIQNAPVGADSVTQERRLVTEIPRPELDGAYRATRRRRRQGGSRSALPSTRRPLRVGSCSMSMAIN